MARRGRECVVAGCDKKAAVGSVVCAEHRETALGEQTDREIIKMTQRLDAMAKYESNEEQRAAAQEFRRGVMRGEYATLFSTEMVQTLAEEGRGYDMKPEIGMMRVAMLRLMLEETDPSHLAHALAKLSGALGKAMERQGAWAREAQHRRDVRKYLESMEGPGPMVEVLPLETRRQAMPEEGEEPEEVAEVGEKEADAEDAVEPEIEAATEAAEPGQWPRPGYPDYYVDVEDFEDTAWGKAAEGSRIARGQ